MWLWSVVTLLYSIYLYTWTIWSWYSFFITLVELIILTGFSNNHLTYMAVVVEWLACLPVTQKIGVRFYLERESSATSGWINVGREWCCRGWSIEGGTPGGLLRTRDGLPRIRKARAAHNVHECESVCAWNKKKTNIVSAPKWLPCMNACMCAVFHCICIRMCSN